MTMLNMTQVKELVKAPWHVGTDVCKAWLDTIDAAGVVGRYPNTAKGWARLLADYAGQPDALFCMEASGGYEKGFCRALLAAGRRHAVVAPKRVRQYAQAMGQDAKNDCLDARAIRDFGHELERTGRLVERSLHANPRLEELGQARRQLAELVGRQKVTREHHHDDFVAEQDRARMAFLKNQMKALDAEIATLMASDERLSDRYRKLMGIFGFGQVSSLALLTDMPELGEISGRRAARLVGLAPLDNQSGPVSRQRRISGGRGQLRRALYMPMISVIRGDPRLKAFFVKLRGKGLSGKAALIACMRKVIVWLNAMLRDGTEWRTA